MIFKYILPIVLVSFCLTASTCMREPDLDAHLFGTTWLHANEEDTDETKIYRPNTYHFPPSRGRTGFSLDADGTFRLFAIAPTDGLEEHTGKWEMVNKNIMRITFAEKEAEAFQLELISVTADLLKVKLLPASR